MNYKRLGQTVLNYRKKNGMTIRKFANFAGISTSLISRMKEDRRIRPQVFWNS